MVTVTWKGTATEEDIKIVKDEALEMVRKHNCIFILNDFQGFFTAATETLTHFIKTSWAEEGIAAGVRYIIHILKPEMETPLQTDDTSEHTKFFYSKLDAVEWIEKQLETME